MSRISPPQQQSETAQVQTCLPDVFAVRFKSQIIIVIRADLHVVGDRETAADPETTVQDNLSTSVSMKPLEHFHSLFVATWFGLF